MKQKATALCLVFIFLCSMFIAYADNYESMLQTAVAYEETGDFDKAIAAYQLAAQLNPEDVEPLLHMAELYLEQDNSFKALEQVDAALAIDPVCGDARIFRARIDILLDDMEALSQDLLYAEVSGVDWSMYPEACLSIADYYVQKQRYTDAEEYYSNLDISLFEADQLVWYGVMLMATGNTDRLEALGLTNSGLRDPKLDAAFESGYISATLEEYFPFPDINEKASSLSSVFEDLISDIEAGEASLLGISPDGRTALVHTYWDDSEYYIYEAEDDSLYYFDDNSVVLSVSPDGDAMLLEVDEVCCVYKRDGELLPLYPDSSRGVGDQDGYVSDLLGREDFWRKTMGQEGFIWSHDGRYAMVAWSMAMMQRYTTFNPMLIDTQTGGVILLAAYESRASVISGACFSRDDRYLYYIIPNAVGVDGQFSDQLLSFDLVRYDFQEDKIEVLLSMPYSESWPCPHLSYLVDGSLLICFYPNRRTDDVTFVRLFEDGDEWKAETIDGFSSILDPDRVLYSESSGWLISDCSRLLRGRYALKCPGSVMLLTRFPFEDGLQDNWWGIDTSTNAFLPLDLSDCVDDADYLSVLQSCYRLWNYVLSQDGRYAFMLGENLDPQAEDFRQMKMFIVRLEDAACVQMDVSIPEDYREDYRYVLTYSYMEWRADGILITPAGASKRDMRLVFD